MRPRTPTPTLAPVLLAAAFLLSLVSPFLPTDYPDVVIYLHILSGAVGLLGAAGLWTTRRWGPRVAVAVCALNILLAVPGVVVEPGAVGRIFAAVQVSVSVLIVALVVGRDAGRTTSAHQATQQPTRPTTGLPDQKRSAAVREDPRP